MAFRKRNVALGRQPGTAPPSDSPSTPQQSPGVRPSPLTSHAVTSTGTPSFDGVLGGHGGLVLGSSIIIGEHDTTDFAGALLRYYAAEGVLQNHMIHVVGVGEGWTRELPGVAEGRSKPSKSTDSSKNADPAAQERMKIAWRYERLGQAGERALPDRSVPSPSQDPSQPEIPFCHTFDLTKRLAIPAEAKIQHIPLSRSVTPLLSVLKALEQQMNWAPKNTIHRVVIPTLLSPAIYPPQTAKPENLLRFMHGLRALLRQYPDRLTAMITIPLQLFPRHSALVRWAGTLADGVLELTPFPHLMDASHSSHESNANSGKDEQPQGLVKVHKLPLVSERGEGGAGAGNSLGEDLAFTLSRRKFLISPFSLPPMEGDQEAQRDAGKVTAKDVEF